MAAPTFPASQNLVEGTGNRSFSSVTTSAGDYLVVEVVGEDAALANVTPSHASLTFTKQNDVGTASHCRVQHWTAPDAAGGTRVVDMTASTAGRNWRARVTVVRGSTGPGTGKATSGTTQTVSVTREGANSAMFYAIGDWNTGAVGTPAWTPGGSTTASQQGSAATYIFGRWDDSGSTATASHGISSPSYGAPAIAVLEMKGTAGGTDATATPAVVATTTALPRPDVNVVAGPAVAVTVAALARPNVNVVAGPAVIATAAALARPDVNVVAGPGVITATVALPQATPVAGGNATATPATVAVVSALPQPGVNVAAGPAVVPVTVALPASSRNVAAGPAVVPTLVALARPGVDAAASPATVTVTVALPASAANVATGPAVIPVVVALPTPSVGGATAATPATITATLAVPRASVNVTAGPGVVPVVVTMPLATVAGQTAKGDSVATVAAAVASVAVVTAIASSDPTVTGATSTSTVR